MAHENHSELPQPETPISSDGGRRQADHECPLRRVLAVNEHGMVVESQRGFEVGSAMVLGCHVEAKASVPRTTGAFVSAETIVVESLPLTGGGRNGQSCFQVTFLFSEISREDREMLVNLSDVEGIRLASGPAARRSGLAIPPPQVFPTVEKAVRKSQHLRADGVDPAASSGCSLN